MLNYVGLNFENTLTCSEEADKNENAEDFGEVIRRRAEKIRAKKKMVEECNGRGNFLDIV